MMVDGLQHGRLLRMLAAIAAASGRRWQEAEEHFESTLAQSEEIGLRMERPDIMRFFALMLMDRARDADDRERARVLLDGALEGYRAIGMPRHEAMAREQLARIDAGARD
jgi:hypothetical protein